MIMITICNIRTPLNFLGRYQQVVDPCDSLAATLYTYHRLGALTSTIYPALLPGDNDHEHCTLSD